MTLLDTDRLSLHYMTEADAPFMLDLLNRPSYYRFIGDRGVRTLEQAETYIRERTLKAYAEFGFNYYLVRLKYNQHPIGIVGLMKRDFLEHADIGFALLDEFAGNGYGFEAASALMAWARTEKGMLKFSGIVQDDNPASIRLLQKLGLRFSKTIEMDGETLLLLEE